MRISPSWLNQYVPVKEKPNELADVLTMLGLESECQEDLPSLDGVVTAKVLNVTRHPNADKLTLCDVSDGERTFPVVCGAPNVAEGQIVPLATVGAVLSGDLKVKKAKIRGQESLGMICSEKELGLSDDHSGIMVLPPGTPAGQPMADLISERLNSLEVDITPNRPDALSHLGIARDLAAKTRRILTEPEITVHSCEKDPPDEVIIKIDDPQGCPRYVAGIVDGVKVGPSPQWMIDRLESVGQRSINNLVDISNYVLLELGHPTHIFDFDTLPTNEVRVRRAKSGELIATLDEVPRELGPEHLLITDGTDPVALAGIMGGSDSAVQETTTRVLIESAYFDPVTIRKGSKSLGMITEASRRFERGADPEATVTAFWRVVNLLEEYADGRLSSEMVDAYPNPIPKLTLTLRKTWLESIAGCTFSGSFIEESLTALGVVWERSEKNEWSCTPPSFRPDLEREIDLIEEVIRLYGYDRIQSSERFNLIYSFSPLDPLSSMSRIHHIMTGFGFYQCFNNSLQSCDFASGSGLDPVEIQNPLSQQLSNLRTSLVPGLLETIFFNVNNGSQDLQLYETGQIHIQKNPGFQGIHEESHLCGLVYGSRERSSIHLPKAQDHSFYSIKGYLESLMWRIGSIKPAYRERQHPQYDSCLEVLWKKQSLGFIGQIRPEYINTLGFKLNTVYGFELSLETILERMMEPKKISPVSVFPKIERDLNFVLDEQTAAGDVVKTILSEGKNIVVSAQPVTIFRNLDLGDGKKSITFNLVFQSMTKTLEDSEVNSIINEIIDIVSKKFGAKLRA